MPNSSQRSSRRVSFMDEQPPPYTARPSSSTSEIVSSSSNSTRPSSVETPTPSRLPHPNYKPLLPPDYNTATSSLSPLAFPPRFRRKPEPKPKPKPKTPQLLKWFIEWRKKHPSANFDGVPLESVSDRLGSRNRAPRYQVSASSLGERAENQRPYPQAETRRSSAAGERRGN